MPKCRVCGKKFGSLSALRDHHNSAHQNVRFVAPKTFSARNLTMIIIIVIIVSSSLIGYLVYSQFYTRPTSCTSSKTITLNLVSQQVGSSAFSNSPIQLLAQDQSSGQIGQPISSTLFQELTNVNDSTLTAIGLGSGVTPPSKICGNYLVSGDKPLVFYVGGEFCPFCAAERWSMVVALSRFGTFSNLTYMTSWSNENPGYQNIETLSFHYANYTGKYISFIGIEEFDRNDVAQQQLSASQKAIMSDFDSSGSIPFMDISNNYSVVGAQFTPPTISGLTWDQIGAQLNNPNSEVGKSIDGAANTLITAICKADGELPTNVCGQSYADLPLAYNAQNSAPGGAMLGIMINAPNYGQASKTHEWS